MTEPQKTQNQEEMNSVESRESKSLYEQYHLKTKTVNGFEIEYSYLSLFLFIMAAFWVVAGTIIFFALWPSGSLYAKGYMPAIWSLFAGLFMAGVSSYMGQALEYMRQVASKSKDE